MNEQRGITIRAATARDLPAIEALLAGNALPIVGVAQSLETFLVAERETRLVGVIGVELCGEYGLLRSAAVEAGARGEGVGRRLVERAIEAMRDRGLRALYLLTTTAEQYFPKFGFATVARDVVPPAIRATEEFSSACPASATVMTLSLQPALDRLRVLFLCTGNSARSQIAEALLATRGSDRFEVASAGVRPAERVNPYAVEALAQYGIDWSGRAPKSIDDVINRRWDLVITVCDRAKESCPILPGHPTFAHWGMEDPAEITGDEARSRAAFREAAILLSRRIDLLLALPASALDAHRRKFAVRDIGVATVQSEGNSNATHDTR